MTDFAITVTAFLVGAILAALFKTLIDRRLKSTSRQYLVTTPRGHSKTFEIDRTLTEDQAAELISSELLLEQIVESSINEYFASLGSGQLRTGHDVDFIAEIGRQKIAIEVKHDLQQITDTLLRKYLTDEPDVSKLLVFTWDALHRNSRYSPPDVPTTLPWRFIALPGDGANESRTRQTIVAALDSLNRSR